MPSTGGYSQNDVFYMRGLPKSSTNPFGYNVPSAAPAGAPAGLAGIGGVSGVPYSDLASNLNNFMAGQAANQYRLNMPSYDALTKQFSGLTGEQLAGKLPQDVITRIGEGAATRGVMSGSVGGANTNADYLKSIGLTSLDMQRLGGANLHQAIADTPVSPTWNPASLFVPEHLAQMELGAARAGMGRGGSSGGAPVYGGMDVSYAPKVGFGGAGGPGGSSNIDYFQNPNPVNSTGPSDFSDWWDVGDDPWWSMFDNDPSKSDFNDPYDPGFWAMDNTPPQTYIPGQPVSDWTQIGNVDWSVYE